MTSTWLTIWEVRNYLHLRLQSLHIPLNLPNQSKVLWRAQFSCEQTWPSGEFRWLLSTNCIKVTHLSKVLLGALPKSSSSFMKHFVVFNSFSGHLEEFNYFPFSKFYIWKCSNLYEQLHSIEYSFDISLPSTCMYLYSINIISSKKLSCSGNISYICYSS